MKGKIIRLDTTSGNGSIIYEDGSVADFEVMSWGSFETTPEIGLPVEKIDGKIIPIQDQETSYNNIKSELLRKRDAYINGSVENGWKIENSNDFGFVIKNSEVKALPYILWFFLLSVIMPLIFGIFGIVIAAIISYFLSISNYILKGVIDYEKNEIVITNKGEHEQTIRL